MRSIQTRYAIVVAACIAAVAPVGVAADREPEYAAIDVPGATFTNAQGINPQGDIVGWYVNASGTHGYLLRDGAFGKIDYPGAAYTDARGLNTRGDIVGAYRMPGEPSVNFHGYLLTKEGAFVSVDFPGHTNTIPQRITSTGLILGCRHDTDLMTTMRGITIKIHDPSEVTETDAFASMNNGATPDGSLIAGLYTDMDTGKGRGYLLSGDTFFPFDVPGSSFTAAWDVNPSGETVGVYRDTSNRFHGFLWSAFRMLSIDYPGATATRAFGINPQGNIVGAYVDGANRTHGFVVTKLRGE